MTESFDWLENVLAKIVQFIIWAKLAAWLSTTWNTSRMNSCSVRVLSLPVWWRQNYSNHSATARCCTEYEVTPFSLLISALLERIWLTLLVATEVHRSPLVVGPLNDE